MSYILILFGCYLGLWTALSAIAMPHRRHLAEIAESLREENIERDFVDGMLASAYSWRSAVMLALVYTMGLFQSGTALDRECDQFAAERPNLANDARVHSMMDAYFASVAAVNPIFGALAYLAKRTFQLKARLHFSAQNAERLTDIRGLSFPV
jgi:hypothetical protein